MSVHRTVSLLVATTAIGGWLATHALAETPPQHLRGTLESVQNHTLSLKTAQGTESIAAPDGTKVFLVSPADISAIKDGKFVGITSVERDGKRVAKEVHVFDDSLRGMAEGHYPWDLDTTPNMMTNANIAHVDSIGSDRVLKLDYKGGSQTIAVPADATIVTVTPSSFDQLQADRKAFVVAKQQDGGLVALAAIVGKDGLKPPM